MTETVYYPVCVLSALVDHAQSRVYFPVILFAPGALPGETQVGYPVELVVVS